MADDFQAQVSKWVLATKARTEAIFKESAQDVFAAAQKPVGAGGNMPVDTGFLRASLQVGLEGETADTVFTQEEAKDKNKSLPLILAIAGASLGDTIQGGWSAEYAEAVEFGHGGVKGRLFAASAVQQWQSIVSKNVARLKALL